MVAFDDFCRNWGEKLTIIKIYLIKCVCISIIIISTSMIFDFQMETIYLRKMAMPLYIIELEVGIALHFLFQSMTIFTTKI